MRSMWKGTIGYGKAAIPVKAYTATEEHDIELHQLHANDGGRIRQKRVCEVDGAEVPFSEIVRGYEMPAGDVVMLTDEDLATLPLATTRLIDVRAFVPLEQIDPISLSKSYYLEPEPAGIKPYVLLSEALQQAGRAAVVKVALRARESLGVLRVRDQVIVLTTMLWPDEIRTPEFPFLHEDVELIGPEVQAAVEAIEQLSGTFVPAQYTDRYREALEDLIEAKIEGREVVRPSAPEEDATVDDLITALQQSVEAAVKAHAAGNGKDHVGKARSAAGKAKAAAGKAKAAADKADTRARTRTSR
ncbi:MAG TPA: Ku protein [Actinophytocola sp.]|uniref:non-homologous end joining protein Ku n=1 Tax=Actinophytocola sp. TaxID=1872138 RepID=UPI002DDD4D78|nr:Ku protein [Actinophytocola sp.]HEV2782409.1 Ku protein [Actinophytocola sp.]